MIESDKIQSIIFRGGLRKTIQEKLFQNKTLSKFIKFSSVLSGIKEIK